MLTPMQMLIAATVAVHAVAAVSWLAASGMVARSGGLGGEKAFPRQMIMATIAILTGGFLWSQLHAGGVGVYEIVLGAGAILAIVAAGIQGVVIGGARRKLKAGGDVAAVRKTMAVGNRIAGGLLGLCFVCMVVSRFL